MATLSVVAGVICIYTFMRICNRAAVKSWKIQLETSVIKTGSQRRQQHEEQAGAPVKTTEGAKEELTNTLIPFPEMLMKILFAERLVYLLFPT